ncbi:MAG TPA: glycine--tRNA ligase subunit beta [Stellaceae bacterium]|nr:glycine--tRNA ligase subunit beta [Stellaceae bacterium]
MADYLLELLTEEIPARMQGRAAEDLQRLMSEQLKGAGLAFSSMKTFVTPRRLVLAVSGLPESQPDQSEERRGPRKGAPDAAVQGFLKSTGLTSLDQCEERDTGKGVFYFALIRRPGKPTAEVLPPLIRAIVVDFPWPKSMQFPAAGFRWVRPINSALSLLDGKVLPLPLDNVAVGHTTIGHRFLAPQRIPIKDFADYEAKLHRASVILDADMRRKQIAEALQKAAKSVQLTIKDDPALLNEVTGLVEYPTVLVGTIDPAFMTLPPEVLTASMRGHQKYFALLDDKGDLAPRFLVVSNMIARDGGKVIAAGNERVLRARLSDAQFFWEQDRKTPLASRVPKLAERVFHAKLGTMEDKVARLEALATEVSRYVRGDHGQAVRSAAFLAKADLSTGMVGEFPELQGLIGRYYALHDGESREVADAIGDHYSPQGPNDRCPTAPVSVAVALADKIDTLVAFFSIGETPTGSRDPFALRRAALGVIRLIIENELRVPLRSMFGTAFAIGAQAKTGGFEKDPAPDLLAFFADRLKVHLREKGVRHDLINAVFTLGGEDDLVRLLARVEALHTFLATDDGANLLVAYRRAANIVRIEEKQDGRAYDGPARREVLEMPQEKALAERLETARAKADEALDREAFDAAMTALATLRPPIDEFYEGVTVNTNNPAHRENRLRLLSEIRATLNRVADFSQIEG